MKGCFQKGADSEHLDTMQEGGVLVVPPPVNANGKGDASPTIYPWIESLGKVFALMITHELALNESTSTLVP